MTERVAVRGRTRRLVAVIAMGALAAAGLTACRSEAGAAAYVGGTQISRDQVSEIASSFPAATLKADNATRLQVESNVVQGLAFNEVAAQFAKDNGFGGTPKPDPKDVTAIAQNFGVTGPGASSNKFATLGAQQAAWVKLLLSKMPSGTPTEADFRDVFTEIQGEGGAVGDTFEQVAPVIQQGAPSNLAQANALRKKLKEAIARDNVSINPRYSDTCIKAPCGGETVPLTDLTVTDPSSGQAQQIPIMLVMFGQDKSPVVLDLPSASPAA